MKFLRRVARVLMIGIAFWLLFACGLLTAVHVYGETDHARPADVIVVLGSGLRRDGSPGPAMHRRTAQAAELYAQGIAPTVICSGGYATTQRRSEADACRELLNALGVPFEAVVLEDRSRSTEENAMFTRELMDANGWRDAVIVSDGYHLLRANWIFQQEGVTGYTSPALPRPRTSVYMMAIGREIAALHWQGIKTVLGLPYTYVPLV